MTKKEIQKLMLESEKNVQKSTVRVKEISKAFSDILQDLNKIL